jgi:hypothetical protein
MYTTYGARDMAGHGQKSTGHGRDMNSIFNPLKIAIFRGSKILFPDIGNLLIK